ASRRNDNGALAHLRKIGPPPYKKAGQVLAMERLDQRYGGVFHKEPRRTWIMVRAIFSGLVSPWEIPRLIHANKVSLEAMNEELLGLDLARSVPSAGVPVLFFFGRYDRHTDGKLAATYFATLRAPVKRLVWFEKSAHNVPFEEPRLFNATVVHELQSVGVRLAAADGPEARALGTRIGATVQPESRILRLQEGPLWVHANEQSITGAVSAALSGYFVMVRGMAVALES